MAFVQNTHSLSVDKRVDLRHCDDLCHEAAQPLWLQEIESAKIALDVRVVEEDS